MKKGTADDFTEGQRVVVLYGDVRLKVRGGHEQMTDLGDSFIAGVTNGDWVWIPWKEAYLHKSHIGSPNTAVRHFSRRLFMTKKVVDEIDGFMRPFKKQYAWYDYLDAVIARGKAYYAAGRWEEASKDLGNIAYRSKADYEYDDGVKLRWPASHRAKAAVYLSLTKLAEGKAEDALSAMHGGSKLEPTVGNGWNRTVERGQWSLAFLADGQYYKALKYGLSAETFEPELPQHVDVRARALYAIGRIDEALTEYNRLLNVSKYRRHHSVLKGAIRLFAMSPLPRGRKPETALRLAEEFDHSSSGRDPQVFYYRAVALVIVD